MVEAIRSRRVDVIATAVWPTAARGLRADFSDPLWYSVVKAYVREDDGRFDGNLPAIDAPDVTIAAMDGEMTSIIADTDFPNASRVSLPQTAEVSQLLLEVATRKADVTFLEPAIAAPYMASNPGSIREILGVEPLRVFPNVLMLGKGEGSFRSTLNSAIAELHATGALERIITRYEDFPGSFGRRAPPYAAASP